MDIRAKNYGLKIAIEHGLADLSILPQPKISIIKNFTEITVIILCFGIDYLRQLGRNIKM
jgi:hypothetical protein